MSVVVGPEDRSMRRSSGESAKPTYKYRPFAVSAMHCATGFALIAIGSEMNPVIGSIETMDLPSGAATVAGILAHKRFRVGSKTRLLAPRGTRLTVLIRDWNPMLTSFAAVLFAESGSTASEVALTAQV